MIKILTKLCFLIFLTSSSLSADIIYVPQDYQKIQDAITATNESDTVIVTPGTYVQQIYLAGKNITLSSLYLLTQNSAYIDSTILSYGLNSKNTIYCGGLDSSSIIAGFTIGSDVLVCKGIECDNASPTITNNVFKTRNDYGILCRESSKPIIKKNKFTNTHSMYYCIELRYGNAIIQKNIFNGKSNYYSSAIKIHSNETPIISSNEIDNFEIGIDDYGEKTKIINNMILNCNVGIRSVEGILLNNTIVNNVEIGVQNVMQGIPNIMNCIIWGNKKDFNGFFSISHSCMWGCLPYGAIDGGGNVFRDPKFIDPSDSNFRLKGESPCIDAGSSNSDLIPKFDLEYNERILDGNGDSTKLIDIGCYERNFVNNPAYVSGKVTLIGGPGSVTDAQVGIGTFCHPDIDGYYNFAISAPDSFYSVIALIDNYLMQEIKNVEIKSGEITQDIDFNLEYYNPDTIVSTLPDTLKFISDTEITRELIIKNISLSDIYIRWIQPGPMLYFDDENFSVPYFIASGDSCKILLSLLLTTGSESNELISDSVLIFFNDDSVKIPVCIDLSIIDGIEVKKEKLQAFYISKNFPNPFNLHTTIELGITSKSDIKIDIYNIIGQKVRSLKQAGLSAGKHFIVWDGRDESGNFLSTGLYFYIINDSYKNQVHKMLLIK
ncbi:MAG: T9SS type A sorting domain-containing protein [Calditrichaceae bacterium]|nr:T9SS type A sorting domain-containing protein [Calditrichaceae bacterium]MBN2709461.1 T9SS type A sorting domain-containing protein [Calditrichaceae bacterium]